MKKVIKVLKWISVRPVTVVIAVFILNGFIVSFGRSWFPDNFRPFEVSYAENYIVLSLGELFIFALGAVFIYVILAVVRELKYELFSK